MNPSDMTHRLTDAIRRMTYRLTHQGHTHPKKPSAQDAVNDMKN